MAMRKMDLILSRINDYNYRPVLISTVAAFAKEWCEKVLSRRKPSTVCSATSHLNYHIIPKLGQLRLDQLGPENQQVFTNQLTGLSRKTVVNVLSTLGSMLTTAENWGYATQRIKLARLVLPDRDTKAAPHFTHSQVEDIFRLAGEPWRTFFIILGMTGMRTGEILGLQWGDIEFERATIHIRRSVWRGRTQSTKSVGSAVPISMPAPLITVLQQYKGIVTPNESGFLFVTRNGRPPSGGKVVEYQLWPILDALGIPRCGLHAFRHSVASFISDAGYTTEVAQQQLRHSDARTTRKYIHRPNGQAEKAMAEVAASFNLDTVGPQAPANPKYLQ